VSRPEGRIALPEHASSSDHGDGLDIGDTWERVNDTWPAQKDGVMTSIGGDWERYGRALYRAMAEVLEEFPEEARPNALETADYWITVGLTIGLERPHQARRLLELIEVEEAERVALAEDAADFLEEALA